MGVRRLRYGGQLGEFAQTGAPVGYWQQRGLVPGHALHGHVVHPTATYGRHNPATQKFPGEHTFVPVDEPHPPQLARSVCVSTQPRLQSVSPAGHVLVAATHVPAEQICPAVHARPHMPQLVASSFKLRHARPQNGSAPQSL
jgi:hypothetical protein